MQLVSRTVPVSEKKLPILERFSDTHTETGRNVVTMEAKYPSGGGRLVWVGIERSLACSCERA